ncbi:Mut7-C RNAse domain-containing protein [Fodinibius halophilus]|uniref:Twitching motility protein PilT n=1 Tax=Fodinibius halophilus TaxID=1736908 RepID=A0A6M1TA54_9BACT|nr:Mut7-C RNAse domain-containing protein [Fodinibius halophilus]NGP87232.1 hypothetical protein [Fodinibius halophilus]
MTKQATLRPVASLKDFIKKSSNDISLLSVSFKGTPAVKDLIEAQGIPHTAIFGLKINGERKSLTYNLTGGEEITAYPFEEISKSNLSSEFISPEKFILDIHLGKLTKKLRLFGFNAILNPNFTEQDIIHISNAENRMILTRNIGLLRHGDTQQGYWVRNTDPDKQLRELFNRFELSKNINPFNRCMECNGRLVRVALAEVQEKVPPKVQQKHSLFYQCQECQKVYWQGSHFKDFKKKVDLLQSL